MKCETDYLQYTPVGYKFNTDASISVKSEVALQPLCMWASWPLCICAKQPLCKRSVATVQIKTGNGKGRSYGRKKGKQRR